MSHGTPAPGDSGGSPLRVGESAMLVAFLSDQRSRFRAKTVDLDGESLRRTLLPSTMTLAGMIKHLAFVEEYWLYTVFADLPRRSPWLEPDWRQEPDWDWHSAVGDEPAELWSLYERSVAESDRIIADALADPTGLDRTSRRTLRVGEQREACSLRWILLHLIAEYAQHNGHVDLIRESIDGRTG